MWNDSLTCSPNECYLLHLEGVYSPLPIKTEGRYSKDQSADYSSLPFSISDKNLENMKFL